MTAHTMTTTPHALTIDGLETVYDALATAIDDRRQSIRSKTFISLRKRFTCVHTTRTQSAHLVCSARRLPRVPAAR